MSSIEYRFIEPLDVLYLRGNKLFGDPGSYGECLIPPWPSVAAGAIRSRMLVDRKIDLAEFAANKVTNDAELGTPNNPGSFAIAAFHLARRINKGVELLIAPPADLVISKPLDRHSRESGNPDPSLDVRCLYPQATNLLSSFSLPLLPVLAQGERTKPETGYWLTQAGWEAYLNGATPTAEHLVHSSELWSFDARVGIGMSSQTRSVEEGKLFSAQALALHNGVGFITGISGATPPNTGVLRFGGDGRAANIEAVKIQTPEPDYQTISQAGRCRIVLTTPGLFPSGWKLPVTDNDNRVALPNGITARLASAAIPRAEIISGWDLASREGKGAPKPAQKVTPVGSVYWLDELKATPEALRKLVETGLWQEPCEDSTRRAEGFNRVAIAAWTNPSSTQQRRIP